MGNFHISKIRAIIYCAECLCDGRFGAISRNEINSEVWGGAVFGEDRLLLAINEIEQTDQFFWTMAFEADRQDRSPAVTAMQLVLSNTRLLVELLPRFAGGCPRKDEHEPKRPRGKPKKEPPHPA